MLEISPVLAGTFDKPDYAAANNIASFQSGTNATEDASGVDARRYTKFDHSATEAGSTTDFSFDDFLDLINPLQHIPVVSSVYREISGESINPISRVTGDILYGGAFGIASAVMGGVSAAGDAMLEADGGKDGVGSVIASLFESSPSSAPTTQLADASAVAPAATASTPAPSTPAPQIQAAAQSPLAALAPPPAPPPLPKLSSPPPLPNLASAKPPATMDPTSQALLASSVFAADPKKLPYGGVMDPSQLQGSSQALVQAQAQALNQAQAQAQVQARMQAQMMNPLQGGNMALALAASAPGGAQMGHTVYAGGLVKGVKPSALLTSPQTPSANLTPNAMPVNAASTVPAAANAGNPLPSELMQDIATLRAVNQYRSTASQSPPAGTNVNVVN